MTESVLSVETKNTRIAIAQVSMYWSCEASTAAVLKCLGTAADQGAKICVFPELALTGFHRQIRTEAEPVRVGEALRQVQALCRERAIACVVGTPSFDGDGPPFNSHVHINENGEVVAVISKEGLTPSEATFFAVGSGRAVTSLHGVSCTSVLCREVEDQELVHAQLPAGTAEIIFWPSLVGKPPSDIPDPDEVNYLPMAQRLAQHTGAHVVQCNWPNALNNPEASYLGESAVISQNGDVLFRLPRDEAGVATFVLGASEYTWSPMVT